MTVPHRAAWPIAALLVAYPLWWALGFGGLAVIVLAPWMLLILLRRRPIRAPRGFGLWLLLLAGYVISALMLGEMPPDTYGEFSAGRMLGYLMRLALYASLMIMVLYLGNLTESELPQLMLVRMLGAMFVATVAGGLLGVFAPRVEFTSPIEWILPEWISGNSFVRNLIHPTAAQMQKVLGHASPRPEAPFEWANAWGSNVSVLLIWFVVGWWVYGGRRRRLAAVPLVVLAAIPIVYSLNRGLWIGLGIACAYLFLRLGARARIAVGSAVAAGALMFFLSPLQTMVAQRLDSPHSNDIRAFTVSATIAAAGTSPLIGYGNTRNAMGNHRTITTGKTGWCPTCGHPPLGSDGQLWHLMITQGFAGAALYVAFFAGAIRRHWPDRSPIGMAGVLVMILTLLYMFVYDGLVTPLSLYLISFALLWRNSMTSREEPAHGPRDAISATRDGWEEIRVPGRSPLPSSPERRSHGRGEE
ncbi:O-antigen ligase [Streptosporangium sp. 'caverna']|uniref:O-antigen ligase family protein n=1 Tax=Streptosporangium sp. 'caverna' TaxID=2202249 RepID=UPI001EF78002|nr:hypothetical protein [Streptosporangium sp. 'caverna']